MFSNLNYIFLFFIFLLASWFKYKSCQKISTSIMFAIFRSITFRKNACSRSVYVMRKQYSRRYLSKHVTQRLQRCSCCRGQTSPGNRSGCTFWICGEIKINDTGPYCLVRTTRFWTSSKKKSR